MKNYFLFSVLFCTSLLFGCEPKLGTIFTKKPNGIFVWETDIMGITVVDKEDFRSDGTVYHEGKGFTSEPITAPGSWQMDGKDIVVFLSKDGTSFKQIYRWEGEDLIRVSDNGKTQDEPPRYRKQ
jgi:hypothetical protein